MKQTIRPQFILLYHCDTPMSGTPGCLINWLFGGVFDSKDEAVKWLLSCSLPNMRGHKTVRVLLPTAFVNSPSDLVPLPGTVTDLAIDEPDDEYKEEK